MSIYAFHSYIWQYTLSTFKILKNSTWTKKEPFSNCMILTLTLIQLNSWGAGKSYLTFLLESTGLKSWTSITETFKVIGFDTGKKKKKSQDTQEESHTTSFIKSGLQVAGVAWNLLCLCPLCTGTSNGTPGFLRLYWCSLLTLANS